MKTTFKRVIQVVSEDKPGVVWQDLFNQFADPYRRWFMKEGVTARPPYLIARRALTRLMPEFEDLYDNLVELAGGKDEDARLLSLYNPTPYISGCSQLAWSNGEPFLIRNYDYNPNWWEGVVLETKWLGNRVIGMSDCMWGLLDGMNEDGLAVSLTFGGRKIVGDGFGIPLILRYVLETCKTTEQAIKTLKNIPAHMAYNVTIIDEDGNYSTVYMRPDEPTLTQNIPAATNHQDSDNWIQYAEATSSFDRERILTDFSKNETLTSKELVQEFLRQPLFANKYKRGFGTLYTAIYWPLRKQVEYIWPKKKIRIQLGSVEKQFIKVTYNQPSSRRSDLSEIVPHIPLAT